MVASCVRATTLTLRTSMENVGVDHNCGGKREGHGKGVPSCSGWVGRLVKTAAVSSLIYGSGMTGKPTARFDEAQPIARRFCQENTYARCLGSTTA